MKRLAVASLFVLLAPLICAGKPGAKWEEQWDAAFERARAEQRLVLVDFYASWCGPCRLMESQTFTDPAVKDLLARFIVLKLDFDEVKKSDRFRVRSIPYYSIYDPSGRQVLALIGYHHPRLFAERLQAVLDVGPEIAEVMAALRTGETAELAMRAGATLVRLKNFIGARMMFMRAAELAEKQHDLRVAQEARIEAAVMRVRTGEIGPALKELRALTPIDAELDAAIWLAIGFGEQHRRRIDDARKAYGRALAVAPAASAIRTQAEEQLAAIERRR